MTDPSRERTVEVMIEIPRGSRNRYEFDELTGFFRLDRVLCAAVHYPTDYGYIPGTHAPDGDHLDALVVVEEPTFPGCLVFARPIGALEMRDEHGEDTKILTVPAGDPRFAHVQDIGDLGDHRLREIETFFATYKNLQGLATEVAGWSGHDRAWEVSRACRRAPGVVPGGI